MTRRGLPGYLALRVAVHECALLCARIIGVRSATRISLAVSVHTGLPVLARTTASIVLQLVNVRERMGLFFQLFRLFQFYQSSFLSFLPTISLVRGTAQGPSPTDAAVMGRGPSPTWTKQLLHFLDPSLSSQLITPYSVV